MIVFLRCKRNAQGNNITDKTHEKGSYGYFYSELPIAIPNNSNSTNR